MERSSIVAGLLDPLVDALRSWSEAEKARVKELIDEDRIEEATEALNLLRPLRSLLAKAEDLRSEFRAWCAGSATAQQAVAEAIVAASEATVAPAEEPPEPTADSVVRSEPVSAEPAPASGEDQAEAPEPETESAAKGVQEPPPEETAQTEWSLAPERPSARLTAAQKSQRRRLQTEFSKVRDRLDRLDATDSWSSEQIARAKADLCRLRAIELEGREAGIDTRPIREAIQQCGSALGRHVGNGMSALATDQTNGKAADWLEYARAFECLAEGEKAAEWIREHRDSSLYRGLLNDLACCGHIVYRLSIERRLPFDKQQEQFKKFVESVAGEASIQCWLSPEKGGPKTEKVLKAAENFKGRFESEVLAKLKGYRREHLLADLFDFVSRPYEGDDFVEVLEEKIERCLQEGTQPSNKKLREALVPFAAVLRPRAGQFGRLVEYVRGDATKAAAASNFAGLEGRDDALEEVSDEDHRKRLEDLRAILKGKRMLIVGGSNGQAPRRQQIEHALDLSAVDWPEVEHDDHVGIFWPKLEKADIAVQLIRFSRHHYGEVLREAREQGKMVARITGGLNIRRIVLDLHNQLVANRTSG